MKKILVLMLFAVTTMLCGAAEVSEQLEPKLPRKIVVGEKPLLEMVKNGRVNFVEVAVKTAKILSASNRSQILQVKTQVKDGEWRAVAAIPLKSVGIVPEQNNKVPALIYRSHPARGEKLPRQHSSWGGGRAHSPNDFSDLVFQVE